MFAIWVKKITTFSEQITCTIPTQFISVKRTLFAFGTFRFNKCPFLHKIPPFLCGIFYEHNNLYIIINIYQPLCCKENNMLKYEVFLKYHFRKENTINLFSIYIVMF